MSQTRETTAAIAANKQTTQSNERNTGPTSSTTPGEVVEAASVITHPVSNATSQTSQYATIAVMLANIMRNGKLDESIKLDIQSIINLAKEADAKAGIGFPGSGELLMVSAIRKAVLEDLHGPWAHVNGIQKKKTIGHSGLARMLRECGTSMAP